MNIYPIELFQIVFSNKYRCIYSSCCNRFISKATELSFDFIQNLSVPASEGMLFTLSQIVLMTKKKVSLFKYIYNITKAKRAL